MAYSTTSAPTTSLFTRFSAAFNALSTRYKNYRLYRETFDGLSALSDHDLADLGLGRSDLRRVAEEAADK